MKKQTAIQRVGWGFAGSILLLFASCKKNNDLVSYNTNQAYVYFALPNTVYKPVEKYIDSLNYSFAVDVPGLQEKKLAIPVNISGLSAGMDRTYSYEIDAARSNYDPALVSISSPVIHANAISDTLFVTIKKGAALNNTSMKLTLRLVDNESFKVGNYYNQSIRLSFTNQLLQPKWWAAWQNYFGPFYPEVYQAWIQLYYLGADPSPELGSSIPGPFYYWDNMPSSAIASWYPVTFMFVEVLRQYLVDNPTYPGGDNTKPRIYLP